MVKLPETIQLLNKIKKERKRGHRSRGGLSTRGGGYESRSKTIIKL